MKRLGYSVAAGLLCTTSVQAQLFDVGLKAGVNRDELSSSFHHEAVAGGHLGVFARVKPPVLPGAQGEVLLTSIGARISADGQIAEARGAALQLPLFAVFAFGPVELHGGGYYERYLSKDLITDVNDVEVDGQQVSVADLADDGFGVLLGAGVHLKHFYAGLRYNHGLDPLGSGPLLGDVYNRQLQVYLGFGFASLP